MAQATDQQMQAYADQRIRPRAELCRALVHALEDDQNSIAEVYDRAANGPAWNDTRSDGPPNLLNSQDVLSYNVVSGILLKCINGTATTADIASLKNNWPQFMSYCVRSVS